MPVPKSRKKQAGLVEEVAKFLGIDPSVVFLDAVPMSSGDKDVARRRKFRRNTLRNSIGQVWCLTGPKMV